MEEPKDSSETEEEEEKSRNWADQVEEEESRPTMVVKTSKEPVEERDKETVKKDEPSIVKRFGLFTARGLIPEEAWEAEEAIELGELFHIGYFKWKKDVRMLNREFHRSTFSIYRRRSK